MSPKCTCTVTSCAPILMPPMPRLTPLEPLARLDQTFLKWFVAGIVSQGRGFNKTLYRGGYTPLWDCINRASLSLILECSFTLSYMVLFFCFVFVVAFKDATWSFFYQYIAWHFIVRLAYFTVRIFSFYFNNLQSIWSLVLNMHIFQWYVLCGQYCCVFLLIKDLF